MNYAAIAVSLSCLLFTQGGLAQSPVAPTQCPKIDDTANAMVGGPAIDTIRANQRESVDDSSPDLEGKLIKSGRLRGASSYDVLYQLTDPGLLAPSHLTLLIAAPMDLKANSPFYIPLKNDELDCLLRAGVQLLLSDGTYHHFTTAWRVDRAAHRYGIADNNYKTFFLHGGNNLLGITSEREKTKDGVFVDWLAESDFREVFKGIDYIASEKDFDAVLEIVKDKDRRWKAAYAAYLSYVALASPVDIWLSLKYASFVLDHEKDIPPEQLPAVKSNLLAGLVSGFLISQTIQIVGSFDPQKVIEIAKRIYPKEEIFGYRAADKSLVLRFDAASQLFSSMVLTSEETILERMIRTAIQENSFLFADQALRQALPAHPTNVRLMAYRGELALAGLKPAASVPIGKKALEQVEAQLLKNAQSPNLRDFLEVSNEFGAATTWIYVTPAFDRWKALATSLRQVAEDSGQTEASRFAATRELLALRAKGADNFCKDAIHLVTAAKSRILASVVRDIFAKVMDPLPRCEESKLSIADRQALGKF